ncbi:MAG: 30S ribosomal protein S5 [Candidatus Yanofskybacteria bacterium CG10_big_fil_rev_8_21_14_0_10_37_15]|uniref:Small ribosomal subunit protein uS5 n=1 Tax=Candidatus Yanofskybacteria bacterium CG10_big_fil_rev_8_21_14_0_10_37_15 TaxID=1975097 RepID=A0A2H0R5Y2_9BACT|nr:MAG: 30S ribosomal protein S5 [Candidatus Yanofskybacteria bacterium CG10_big_fil_rev_8_21_14_0_10_37_15]
MEEQQISKKTELQGETSQVSNSNHEKVSKKDEFQKGTTGRSRGGFKGRRPNRPGFDRKPEYEQKVLAIDRVSRVTKGGKRFSFRATIAIGDMKGKVGVGMAKGKDVVQSIQKAYNQAKKNMLTVPIKDGTIPYQVEAKYNSAVVLLKPARGGVKAGGPVRVVAKLSGITRLTGKLLKRTNNKVNVAMATIEALKKIRAKNFQR